MLGRRGWLLVGLLTFVLACDSGRDTPVDAIAHDRRSPGSEQVEDVRPLPLGVVGCHALFHDGTCLRADPLPLVLWLPGAWSADEFELRLDGRLLDRSNPGLTWEASERGLLIRMREQPVDARVTLGHRSGAVATVHLGPMPAAYMRVFAMIPSDSNSEAWQATLHQLGREREGAQGRVALLLDYLQVRIALNDGDPAAYDVLVRLANRAAVLGEHRGIAQLQIHAAWMLLSDSEFGPAADAIQAARRFADLYPAVAVDADHLDGTLAQRIGQVEVSLELLERAAQLARDIHLGDDPRYWDMPAMLAVTQARALADIGRADEAEALGNRALTDLGGRTEVTAKRIRNNVAWIRVLRREDDPRSANPVPEMRAVVEQDPRVSTWLNLAIASSRVGSFDEAAQALDRLDVEQIDDRDRVWFEIAASRVALGRDPAAWNQARAHLDRAFEAAEHGRELDALLRVRLERAQLEFAAGQLSPARAEFELAEQLADRIALSIDGTAGRSSFSTSRSQSRGAHVELLLELGDRSAALCTVLGSRARHLRALAVGSGSLADRDSPTRRSFRTKLSDHERRKAAMLERERSMWELSAVDRDRVAGELSDEAEHLEDLLRDARRLIEQDPPAWRCESVRPREPSHVLLTMISDAAGTGWYFFLDRGESIDVVHLEQAESAAELAVRALTEFDPGLRDAAQLTVVATGEFVGLDFQTLVPASLPVVHGLGLGDALDAAAWRGQASVHAGSGGLVHAEREAASVGDTLSGSGWQLVEWTPNAAIQPDLLHFAGHGERAGTTGWLSTLQLASGERLTSGELIAGQRSARLVVLGACTAGMTSPEAIDGGMNMAVAFLLAGAELVIAPDHVVDDSTAAELAKLLYRGAPSVDRAVEMRAHLMERLAAAKASDPRFHGWRVWVR